MKNIFYTGKALILMTLLCSGYLIAAPVSDSPVIYINQVGFDSRGPKIAILQTSTSFERSAFLLINALSGDTVYA
ncbi:MAG TPA: cellulase N-terminal Ig-like domain-containing protein, partial [Puia sp.]|nr:cellulase N-terminal Ig-like domain-containing protein [Puia sp.]